MKIIIFLLLILLLNCYDAKKENPNTPIISLFLTYNLNPYPFNNINITFQSKDLPGAAIAIKKFANVYYALIENENNTNLVTLYTSSNGTDFSNSGQTINISTLSSFGNTRFFFSHNSEIYYASISNVSFNLDQNQNVVSTSTYKYYTYSNGLFSSLQTKTIPSIAGINGNSTYNARCINSLNNNLFILNDLNNFNSGSTSYGNSIWTGDLQNNTFSNLNSSPAFSSPRSSFFCSQIDSTIYLFGGIKTGCSGGNCQYTDLWSSLDGNTYTRVNSNFNYNNVNFIKLNNGALLAIPGINNGSAKSTDGGANWSSIYITSGVVSTGGNFTSTSSSVGLETDGITVFIYSPNKVYYGNIP